MALNAARSDTTTTTGFWGGSYSMDVYYASSSDSLQLSDSSAVKRIPVFSFGDTDDFAGATIDSAKLNIYTDGLALNNVETLYIWSCTDAALQLWNNAYDDASYVEADASVGTRWGSYDNLGDINETNAGVAVGITREEYGTSTNSWNNPIDVTTLVQDQIDNSMDLIFLFFPNSNTYSNRWGISNSQSAATHRPYLEVWVSE